MTSEQLCPVDHRAIIAWGRIMREEEGAAASTIRCQLAVLSSLFTQRVLPGATSRSPIVDVERSRINREDSSTAAFPRSRCVDF
jgi:hypothetical protein